MRAIFYNYFNISILNIKKRTQILKYLPAFYKLKIFIIKYVIASGQNVSYDL